MQTTATTHLDLISPTLSVRMPSLEAAKVVSNTCLCSRVRPRALHADSSLIPVPVNASTSNETLYDYLVISDVFATDWKGLEYAGFETGDTVAVFGAGAVGLCASFPAILRGASRVYTVDRVQARLDLAASIGAIPINYEDSDPVAQIMALEPNGVTRSVDAVGFEARNAAGEVQFTVVLDNAVQTIRRNRYAGRKWLEPNLPRRSFLGQRAHHGEWYRAASPICGRAGPARFQRQGFASLCYQC